jgi:hypothetical protein
LAVNALASAIHPVSEVCAIAALPVSGTLGTARASASTSAEPSTSKTSTPEAAAASSAAKSTRTAASSSGASRRHWYGGRLAIHARLLIQSRRPAKTACHIGERPSQAEIILPILQRIADCPIHQERFV